MKKSLLIIGIFMAIYTNVMADVNYTTPNWNPNDANATYGNAVEEWKTLTVSGAESLTVTVKGETELYYDRVYIRSENNVTHLKRFHGVIDETFDVDGNNTINVHFKSDYSVVKSGVIVTVVEKNTTVSVVALNVERNATVHGTTILNGDLDANGTTTLVDLEVSGAFKLDANTTTLICNADNAGRIYFDSNGSFMGCNGSTWRQLD